MSRSLTLLRELFPNESETRVRSLVERWDEIGACKQLLKDATNKAAVVVQDDLSLEIESMFTMFVKRPRDSLHHHR